MHRDGTHSPSELPGAPGPRVLGRPPSRQAWGTEAGSGLGAVCPGERAKVDGSAKGTSLLVAGRRQLGRTRALGALVRD